MNKDTQTPSEACLVSADKLRELTERIIWLHSELRNGCDELVREKERLTQECLGVAGLTILTQREQAVYGLLLREKANKEIADNLNISIRTVKFHVSNILLKFRVDSRSKLLMEVR
jgi:two-component system, sensor histidine kinase LadS